MKQGWLILFFIQLITLVVEQTIVLHTMHDKIIPKLINKGPANSEYIGEENQINSKCITIIIT